MKTPRALAFWHDRRGLCGVGSPSSVAHAGGTPGVLALHGFGGTPREVELVVEVARGRGLRVRAPLLPGHGTRVAELAASRFPDWLAAAAAALDELTADGRPAVVVGLSLGAVLAAELAAREPRRVVGLGLLANALWLPTPITLFLDAMERLRAPDLWVPKLAADIRDPRARAEHLTYGAQPLRAASEILRGARAVRERLGAITVPTLVVHGLADRVCPPGNALRAAARLTGTVPRVVLLARSRHIVTRDVDRAELAAELDRWLGALQRGSGPPHAPVEP